MKFWKKKIVIIILQLILTLTTIRKKTIQIILLKRYKQSIPKRIKAQFPKNPF